jgi:hypothetical protein
MKRLPKCYLILFIMFMLSISVSQTLLFDRINRIQDD